MTDDRHEIQTGVDDLTSRPYQLVSVELTRQDVESDDFGEYSCHCYAFGTQENDEGIRSDPAKIRLACKFDNAIFKHMAHLSFLHKRIYVNVNLSLLSTSR